MKPLREFKEADLFDWLKENVYPDLVKSMHQMSRWDCYSPSTRHRIELKCRKAHYPTLLLEEKKFVAMTEKCRRYSDAPIYINSTPQGIYAFDLSLVTTDFNYTKNPATTQFGNTKKVFKSVSYLDLREAKVFYENIKLN